jgi:pyruvate/2-oxoglutarate dehydrogenase complex dihydrolipoamide acyltransferase (E2) component
MARSVIMPKTDMAMEEGTIVRWLKKPGDTVTRGEPIAVIETDKVTMDLEAEDTGTLLAMVRGDGAVAKATDRADVTEPDALRGKINIDGFGLAQKLAEKLAGGYRIVQAPGGAGRGAQGNARERTGRRPGARRRGLRGPGPVRHRVEPARGELARAGGLSPG